MDYVRSVVLKSVFERKISHIEKDESQRKCQDEQCDFRVIILQGDVESESHSIEDLNSDVGTTNTVIFELQFELSVELLLRVLKIE